jgi:hypothetical protein
MHEITVTYDRHIIRRSVRCFWLRFTWKGMLAMAIMVPLIASQILSGDRSWGVGFGLAVCLMGIFTAATLYFVLLSRSMQKLNGNPTKEVRMTFTEERFSIVASDSDGTMPWKSIKRIWRFSDCWLIFLGGGASYFTLPLKSVNSMVQAFIIQQVKAHGGRVK